MKKIISCVMICIVIVISYLYSHIDINNYIYDRNIDATTFYATGVLKENENIIQTFISQEDSIDGINIKVATSGNVEHSLLKYALLDESSNAVFQGTVSGNDLENNKFNRLNVEGVKGTKGKQYTLVLSVENSDEQNGFVFYIAPKKQENIQLLVRDNEVEGTLVTRIICYRYDVETNIVALGMVAFVFAFMKILYRFFK